MGEVKDSHIYVYLYKAIYPGKIGVFIAMD